MLKASVPRASLMWLFIAHGLAIFPLFFNMPLWLPFVWAFSVVWRFQVFKGRFPFPSGKIKSTLALLSVVALVWSYAGDLSVEAMVAFLVVSFCLKLIELKSKTDVLLVLNIGFVVVASQFLFYQTITKALYALVSLTFLLAAWNGMYRVRALPIAVQLRKNLIFLAQCIPLMLVLFLVLPRFGQIWSVPLAKSVATTGFSDSMSPGDFSSLSRSNDPAFRVTLESIQGSSTSKQNQQNISETLLSSERYWRGLVLDEFDGRRWRFSGNIYGSGFSNSVTASIDSNQSRRYWEGDQENQTSKELEYTVLLEPHQRRWLFSLASPKRVTSSSLKLRLLDQNILQTLAPVAKRESYQVTSVLGAVRGAGKLSEKQYATNTQLPENKNPKTIALAEGLRAESETDEQIVEKILSLYQQSFFYTLQPPTLGSDSVDEFLFDSQRGFCEHFASSFVVLMRAAGIPARVVVGYLGGEVNPLENYILVRQSEAHAWAEIWLEESGWQRVDPTSAVSPLRIEMGLQEALGDSDQQLLSSSLFNAEIFNALRLRLDALNFEWQRWVLAYDTRRQAEVLERLLGGLDPWRIALFFVGGCGALMLIYLSWLLISSRVTYVSEEQKIYSRYLLTLSKRGQVPLKGETPFSFAARLAEEIPEERVMHKKVAQIYCAIAYENKKQQLPALKLAVANFR